MSLLSRALYLTQLIVNSTSYVKHNNVLFKHNIDKEVFELIKQFHLKLNHGMIGMGPHVPFHRVVR